MHSQRFAPLPGLPAVSLRRLESGRIAELHAVYGGLGSGRLVIAGDAGSGKSGAAVLLVLAALKHRRDQATEADRLRVPVPVMFSLHGWDPDAQQVQDWLAERLQQTYPLLTGRSGIRKAARLLDELKLAVILDDLDGMPKEMRPVALRALSQQAAFRLIVLTRSNEMAVAAASRGPLASGAAIELRPVDPADAADYLTRVQLDPAPPGWRELIERLRSAPGCPLAQALNSPLNLTLVRDTFRGEKEIKDFLGFCEAPGRQVSDISNYLLDRVLCAAYARRPGDPPLRYNLETAWRALHWLADQMRQDELPWWGIRAWAHPAPRIIATGIAFGAGVGVAAGLEGGTMFGLTLGLTAALIFGLLFGLPDSSEPPNPPRALRHAIRPSSVIRALPYGLVGGVPLGLAAGLAAGLKAGLPAGLAAGLTFGLAGGLAGELYGVLSRSGAEMVDSLTPRRSWRSNRLTGLAVGLSGGVAGGLAFGIALGLAGGLATGLTCGLGVALAVGRAAYPTRERAVAPPAAGGLTAYLTKGRGVVLPAAAGLTAGSGIGLAVELTTGPPAGLPAGLVAGLIGGPLLGLAAGLMWTSTWSATLAFVQLAASQPIPVRFMHFLEDARDRKVLRTVGPLYQFRHAHLRDRLIQQKEKPECQPSP